MRVRTDNAGVARARLPLGASLLAAVLLVAGCSLIGDDGPDPQPTVDAFAAAWSAGDQAGMASLTADSGREVDLAIRQFQGALGVTGTEVEAGSAEDVDGGASAPLTVSQTLAGLGTWTYDTELPLVRSEDDWVVDWSPASGSRPSGVRSWPRVDSPWRRAIPPSAHRKRRRGPSAPWR